MYAIVKTGGKQYKVEQGQRLLVERLAAQEGELVSLQPLMYRAEEVLCGAEELDSVTVSAKVLEHVRGEKLRVFKFKPKRGYRRRTGHRQALTRIEVTEIALAGKGATAGAAKSTRAKRAAAEGKPASSERQPRSGKRQPASGTRQPASAGSKPRRAKESEDGA